jgi:PatG C-terminal
MDCSEASEPQTSKRGDTTSATESHPPRPMMTPPMSIGPVTCATCGTPVSPRLSEPQSRNYVYALGRLAPRFPGIAVEKEFAQATSNAETAGLTDRAALHRVLSQRQHRYLARNLCWVFTIEGLETYILMPRDPADVDLLLEAVRAAPRATDVDVVIGIRGPIAPPEMCNGLMVPIVLVEQLYSFDVDSLIKAIPRPKEAPPKGFAAAAEEVFMRSLQMTDNAGATDEHRALNYLTVRYPAIYANAAEAFARNSSLSGVDARPSSLSSVRNIVDVVFSYTHRQTDVTEKYLVRVDVTDAFPFLVSKLAPYYDR